MTDIEISGPASPSTRSTGSKLKRWHEYAASALLIVIVLFLLEFSVDHGLVSRMIAPAPSSVWNVLVDGFASGFYQPQVFFTVSSTLVGFLIASSAAIVIAGTLVSIPFLDRILTPYFVAFQSMPKIALAPLIVIWFGFGELSKIVIVTICCFFPIFMSALSGLKLRDRDRLELMQSLGATRMQLFFRLRLPQSLPAIFSGLHIGVVYALIGTVVAEFVGTNGGIGYVLLQAKADFDIAGVYACLLMLMIFGVILHLVMGQIEKRIAFWAQDVNANNR